MRALICAVAVLGLVASRASADIVYSTPGSTYSENFDSLANTGTTNAWTDDSTIKGWLATRAVSPPITVYRADNGTSNAGAIYSFGATSSTERAFGSISSGTPGTITFGVRLTNGTANVLSDVTVTFDGEQWRDGGAVTPNAQSITASYVTGPGLTLGSAGYIAASALNFTSPTFTNTGSGVAIDGNASTNRIAGITTTLTGLSWNPGEELIIKWTDINDIGNDHGLALDNFSLSAVPEAPAKLLGLAVCSVVGLAYGWKRFKS